MQLDNMYVNPNTQDLYAQIIAIEDIIAEYGTDCKLIKPQPNKGETNNEKY